jgi:asparagine synthase (glutamine-hydrolysing)
MPGIVGLVTRMSREQAEPQLLRMVEALRHEPFYVTGTWVDESLGVYVGWVARKTSAGDGMPLRSARGDVVLVFSGETFPESTAGLVDLYEDHPRFPEPVNGRFHGLVADRLRGTSTLFNDRYGMHRLYYHEGKDTLYFSAEAKAILAVRPELRRVDPRGLGEFVSCGCVLENRTLFEGVHVLPGGAAWSIRKGSIEARRAYFHPREWEEQPKLDPDTYYREIREVFSRSLPRYFDGHERIGMSLTGGLDTRMIMAWQRPAPRSLPCYTFGGMFRDCRDVVVARQVARACGQTHEVIPVDEGFLSQFAHYAERTVYLTDGCVGTGHSPDLYLNERAREIAPVRMTGNYGGEVLRRVRAFKPEEPLGELFRPEFLSHVRRARETYTGLLAGHPLSFAVFKQAPWHHYGLLALEETQLSLRSPYLDNDLVRTVFRAPDAAVVNDDVSLQLIAAGNPALRWIRTDRGVAGGGGAMSETVYRRLLEFLFKAEYAYDYGMPQWVAGIDHRLARLHLERLFLGRHKFHHFRIWYRDVLSSYVRDMLLDSRTRRRPYLEPKTLEAVVENHLTGRRNYTTEIHKVLTLELVHRLFID